VQSMNTNYDRHSSEYGEKLASKDQMLQELMKEVKTLKSTMRGQDATISYFRQKMEEQTKELELAKKEKAKAKADFRKVEHLSQQAVSPRGCGLDDVGESIDDLNFNIAQDLAQSERKGPLTGAHESKVHIPEAVRELVDATASLSNQKPPRAVRKIETSSRLSQSTLLDEAQS